ncbi:MAG: hypothetical protein JNK05_11120 [Myxococcales bacterium]|nr:hypothetical protein [Myxococcales bacterium]
MRFLRSIAWASTFVAFVSLGCGTRTGLRVRPGAIDATVDDDVIADATVVDSIDAVDAVVDDQPSLDVIDDRVSFDCRVDPRRLCDDNNACTVDTCGADGRCVRAPVRCDDEDPCTLDRCEASRGCVFTSIECGGCADGVRDAFRDRTRYPNIAGCAGGFALPGLNLETAPTCDRIAGDDGPNPNGTGCRASDLCATGFHVCRSAGEVRARSVDGCSGARDAEPSSFWATRQTGPGCLQCATGTAPDCTNADCRSDCAATARTTNDIFGCGSVGSVPQASCAPLDRSGNNLCSELPAPWRCDSGAGDVSFRESEFVVKPGPRAGGVLCCRD